MRAIVAALLFAMLSSRALAQDGISRPVPQEGLSRSDLFILGNVVVNARVNILRDSTRISYCAIDQFWDSTGKLLLELHAAAFSRYSHRSMCPKHPEKQDEADVYNVTLSHLRVYPDSITIMGSSKRGNTRLFEQYKIKREQGVLRAPEYLVYATSHENRGS